MKNLGLQVVVIGAGIGGMAAAIALAQQGAKVRVLEQSTELGDVGAGLQVSANGRKALVALGVVDGGAHPAAMLSSGTEFRDGARGRFVTQIPPPNAGPTWYMHRADLLGLLVKRATDLGVSIDLGRHCAPGAVSADLIIAADGVRSQWRAAVDAAHDPEFTGHVAWRALVPWNAQGGTSSAVVSMGRGAHVVSYPLRGGSVMNLVAFEERRDWTQEGWRLPGDPAEFQDRFSQFGGLVGEMMQSAYDVNTWALFARPVATRWVNGTTVLLGDAAHPTLPFMAQGACLALEDAVVLERVLSAETTLDRALARYQILRKKRAQDVVALAAGNAWRFHLAKPMAWGAQAVLTVGAGALARRLEWVYSYDAARADQT